MAVIVDQKRLGGGSHSTVGTVTDIHGVLRLLFSRVGKPSAGGAIAYSFNDPRGACPECGGLGKKVGVASDDFLDMSKSLNEGAMQVPFFGEWEAQAYTLSGFFDNDKKLSKFTKDEMDLLLHGKDRKFKAKFGDRTINLTYAGIIDTHRALLHPPRHQDAQRTHAESGDAVPQTARMSVLQRRAPQPGRAREQDQRPQHRRSVVARNRRTVEGGARDQRAQGRGRSCRRSSSGCRQSSISGSNT